MSELNFNIDKSLDKERRYESFLSLFESLCSGEDDNISTLANACAALKEAFDYFWVGFYLAKGDELILGPFQGSVACTRIHKGRGVCGKAWEKGCSIVVEDVDKFPGHIACSSLSRSEIVIPIQVNGYFYGVLDIDSDRLNAFDSIDLHYLEKIIQILGKRLSPVGI